MTQPDHRAWVKEAAAKAAFDLGGSMDVERRRLKIIEDVVSKHAQPTILAAERCEAAEAEAKKWEQRADRLTADLEDDAGKLMEANAEISRLRTEVERLTLVNIALEVTVERQKHDLEGWERTYPPSTGRERSAGGLTT